MTDTIASDTTPFPDTLDTLQAQQPLAIVVSDAGRDLLALLPLLRQAAPMLEHPDSYSPRERHALAQAIRCTLRGEMPSDTMETRETLLSPPPAFAFDLSDTDVPPEAERQEAIPLDAPFWEAAEDDPDYEPGCLLEGEGT